MRDPTLDHKIAEARDGNPRLQKVTVTSETEANTPARGSKGNLAPCKVSPAVRHDRTPPPRGIDVVAGVWQRLAFGALEDVPPSSRKILDYLLREADENAEIVCYVPDICRATGLSRRTVQRHLAALARKAWIWRTFEKIRRDYNAPTLYRILSHGKVWARSEREPDPRVRKPFPRERSCGGGVTIAAHLDQPSSAFGDAILSNVIQAGAEVPAASSCPPTTGCEALPEGRGFDEGDGGERLPVDDNLSCMDLPPELDRSPSPVTDPISPPIASLGDRMSNPTRIRARLMESCLGDLIGDGFERRLDRLRVARQLPIEDFLPLIGIVGAKREAGIFDAAGRPSKWTGAIDAVRGYCFVAISRQKHHAAPKEPERKWKLDLVWNHDRDPRPVVDATPLGEQRARMAYEPMKEVNLSPFGKEVLEVLRAEHDGVRSLLSAATPDIAAFGEYVLSWGKVRPEDILAKLRWFALCQAWDFRRSRWEPEPENLKGKVRAAIRGTVRGCAKSLAEKLSTAKYVEPGAPKVDVRQPGTLAHVNSLAHVPIAETTPEQKAQRAAIFASAPVPFKNRKATS